MSDAWLIAFDRCGQLPRVEHSGKFNRIVRDFLSGARPDSQNEVM